LLALRTPQAYSSVHSAAVACGFYPSSSGRGGAALQKIAVGGVVTADAWPEIAAKVRRLAGITLPPTMPHFQGTQTIVELSDATGKPVSVSLVQLERAMRPALFISPERPGLILPIRRAFAEQLFSGAPQLTLLPRKGAVLSSDRVYFKSPRTGSALIPGIPVVFYESAGDGGRAAAFASATVRSNRIIWSETVSERLLQKGVLDRSMMERLSVGGLISILHFENVLLFQRAVPFKRLKQLGAADGANLVTIRRLAPSCISAILTEGKTLAL
jgi:hypothetical protein